MPVKNVGQACGSNADCKNKNCVKNICTRRKRQNKKTPKKVGSKCSKNVDCVNKNCLDNICTRRTKKKKASPKPPSPKPPSPKPPSPKPPSPKPPSHKPPSPKPPSHKTVSTPAKKYLANRNELNNENKLVSKLIRKHFRQGDVIINEDDSEDFYIYMTSNDETPYLGYAKEGQQLSMPLNMTNHTRNFFNTYINIFFDTDVMPYLHGEATIRHDDEFLQTIFKQISPNNIYKIEFLMDDEDVKFKEIERETNKVLRERVRPLRM